MRRTPTTIVLLATALAFGASASAQTEPSSVDLQGLEALHALEEPETAQVAAPAKRSHADLEASLQADPRAEEAESRMKALIEKQLDFQTELMDESRSDSTPAVELADANPRTSPRPPQERELPLAIFDSEEVAIPPGTWGNGSRLKLIRLTLDADGDGNPELQRWLDRESQLQIRREEDRDYDGVTDGWSDYEWGEIVSRVLDSNGDGNPDVWERYGKGRMSSREVDRDDDGVRDAFYTYRGDSLVEERHDSNNDGQIDRVISYEERVRVSTEEDLDTDGRMDTWTSYADVGGEELISRIERDSRGEGAVTLVETFDTASGQAVLSRKDEDVNGDGEVDVISIYEEGKLIRREISDPALVEL